MTIKKKSDDARKLTHLRLERSLINRVIRALEEVIRIRGAR